MRNRKGSFEKIGHFIPQVTMCLLLILCLSACGTSKDESKETRKEAVSVAGMTADGGHETSDSEVRETSAGQPVSSNEDGGEEKQDSDQMKKGRQLIGAFETLDLEGNTVTETVFSQADVTFVNVWGTFCPPCIGEMPDLEKIYQELPDNIQMIGILCDVMSMDAPQYRKALEIVEETGVTYPCLIGNESMTGFLSSVRAVPTSFFVDSDGCIIGSPIVGADPAAYQTRLEELK